MEELTGLKGILALVFETALSSEVSADDIDRPEADGDMIKQAYDEIISACEAFDTERIEEVLGRMREYRVPDEDRIVFEKIDTAASQFDYDIILELIPADQGHDS